MPRTSITAEACKWFDLLPQPIWIFERETLVFRWANSAAASLIGYSASELAGRRLDDCHLAASRADLRAAVQQLGADKEESNVWTLVRSDGSRVDVLSKWRPVEFDGTPSILSTIRDVTPLTEAERHQNTMARMAERLLDLGRWEYDVVARRLHWSDRVYDLFGLSADDPEPDYIRYIQLVHPDDRAAVVNAYRNFSFGGPPFIEFEHRIVRPDGTTVRVKGVGERRTSGGRDLVVGVVQDVTQMANSARRLSEAESLLRLAGDHARFGAWQVDLASSQVLWTEQVARIHGLAPEYQPSFEEAMNFYAPEYRGLVREAFEQCVRTGQEFELVCQIITAEGQRVWVRSIGRAIRDERGAIASVHGAFQDISVLMEAEARALTADAEKSRVLESISDAFFALDQDWRFTYINQRAEEYLQLCKEDLLGRNMWDVYPEAVGSIFQERYESVLATGVPQRFEEFAARLERWFEYTAYPMPEGVSVYFRDVTNERAQSEYLRLVNAAVSRQNDILLITRAGVPDSGRGGQTIVYVNEAFTRRTGYAATEVLGRTPRILQGPNTDPAELTRIREAISARQPVRSELVNYTKNGDAYHVELDIVPLADDQGSVTHWVAVQRDITERKRAEAALQASEARFKLVARATNDIIWDWDFSARKMWWSAGISEVFGYPAGDAGLPPEEWISRIHPDDRATVLGAVRAAIASKADRWSHEYRCRRADDSWAVVSNRAFILRAADGRPLRILGSLTDLSEQRRLEERLRESQKLEAVGQLTGGVAHDFNNLLTVILGNAEELSQRLSHDPQLRVIAEMTSHAAERGAELTNRLLAFARRQPLQPKVSDLGKLLRGMEGLFRRTLSENIDIEFVQGEGPWLTEVDPGQLEVALLNLVVNARDAMPSGGRLTLETANVRLDEDYAQRHSDVPPGRYVMVSVSDTGTGMDKLTASRAFEPFFTTKEVGEGSGLGLSMVFGFAKQSRGHVSIYTEAGEGTSVKLYFPCTAGKELDSEAAATGDAILGGTERVLVVEDDAMVRAHLAAQLKGLGYDVIEAGDAPEALAILNAPGSVSLLLTDIVLPGGLNGRELAEAARAVQPGMRVLYTSGYSENAIVHHGRLDPGVELLGKPYRRRELAGKVRKVLDKAP